MKNTILLFAAFSIIAVTSCNQSKKEENTTIAPVEQPAAQPAAQPAETAPPSNDGTTIQMNEGGVSVESKDGSKTTNVSLSGDSSKIEISRPK